MQVPNDAIPGDEVIELSDLKPLERSWAVLQVLYDQNELHKLTQSTQLDILIVVQEPRLGIPIVLLKWHAERIRDVDRPLYVLT